MLWLLIMGAKEPRLNRACIWNEGLKVDACDLALLVERDGLGDAPGAEADQEDVTVGALDLLRSDKFETGWFAKRLERGFLFLNRCVGQLAIDLGIELRAVDVARLETMEPFFSGGADF